MSNRITEKMLDHLCGQLNVGAGIDPYAPHNTQGKYVLSGAYGGWQLQRVEGAGVRSITSGYVPKRELYDAMYNILQGISIANQGKN